MEWPLFLSAMALLVVVGLSVRRTWAPVLALPVYGFLAWYLTGHARRLER